MWTNHLFHSINLAFFKVLAYECPAVQHTISETKTSVLENNKWFQAFYILIKLAGTIPIPENFQDMV